MRELGRVIRAYYHDRQTQWDKVIERFENTTNNTQHFSTGETPADLYPSDTRNWIIDTEIQPETPENVDAERMREKIRQHLEKKAIARKRQTDKHGPAKEFEAGDKVWFKLHRRSDAS